MADLAGRERTMVPRWASGCAGRNLCCCYDGLAWVPVAFALLNVFLLFGTYAWAEQRHDVYVLLPYISDTGAKAPERSVFTLGLCFGAAMLFAIVLVRYLQVKTYYRSDSAKVARLNRWSYFLGVASAVGMLVVASFQDNEVFLLHAGGALVVFLGGNVYMWMQAIMTLRMKSSSLSMSGQSAGSKNKLGRTRILFSLLATCALIGVGIGGLLAYREEQDRSELSASCIKDTESTSTLPGNKTWPGYWKPCMRGYSMHLVSTFSEWLLVVFFGAYFVTFSYDFQKISLSTEVRLAGRDGRGHYEEVSNSVVF